MNVKKTFVAVLMLALLLFTVAVAMPIASAIPVEWPNSLDLGMTQASRIGGMVFVLLALGAGVFGVKIVHPSAPPYLSGGFNGSLDLNKHNDAVTPTLESLTSEYSKMCRITGIAVNVVSGVSYNL